MPETQRMPSIWSSLWLFVGRTIILSVCRAKLKVGADVTNEGAIFDALCKLTIQRNCASVPLGNHVYDQQLNKWVGRPSMPQPFVRPSLGIEKEDHEHFGLQLSFSPDHISVDAMANTGCKIV